MGKAATPAGRTESGCGAASALPSILPTPLYNQGPAEWRRQRWRAHRQLLNVVEGETESGPHSLTVSQGTSSSPVGERELGRPGKVASLGHTRCDGELCICCSRSGRPWKSKQLIGRKLQAWDDGEMLTRLKQKKCCSLTSAAVHGRETSGRNTVVFQLRSESACRRLQ